MIEPVAYPKLKAEKARVDSLLAAGELHAWPGATKAKKLVWNQTPASFLASRRDTLLAALAASPKPLDLPAIRTAIAYPTAAGPDPLLHWLTELAREGHCFIWPAKGKPGVAFWHLSLELLAEREALDLASSGPRTAQQLAKDLALRVSGLTPAKSKERVAAMIERRQLIPIALNPKQLCLLNPASPTAFLQPVVELRDRLLAAGVSLGSLRTAIAQLFADPPTDEIYKALREAEPQRNAHFSITRLRAIPSLAHLDKPTFDRACLDLRKSGHVDLHYHDAPQFLSPSDRDQLVLDTDQTHYIAISWR